MEFLSKEQKMKILDKIFGKDEMQGEIRLTRIWCKARIAKLQNPTHRAKARRI